MRVLVVEDTPALAEWIARKLSLAGMTPSLVGNGVHAETMIVQAERFKRPYDVVVLDLTLPGKDGLDVLASMRRRRNATPVLILSARSSVADRVTGLEQGADDYLAKPFEAEELVARLRAILRRKGDPVAIANSLGNLSYDAARGLFTVDGCALTLTPRLLAALDALYRRRGAPVAKEYLTSMETDRASDESIDTIMFRLRKRLRDAGATVEIRTLKLVGFMLVGPSVEDHANA